MDHMATLMERASEPPYRHSTARRLAKGAIIGIAIACIAILLGLLLCCYCCCFRRRRERARELESQPPMGHYQGGGGGGGGMMDRFRTMMPGGQSHGAAPIPSQSPPIGAPVPQGGHAASYYVQQPAPSYR